MELIVFVVTVVIEIGFMVWSLITRRSHDSLKMAVRGGGALLILMLIAVGTLPGFRRYGLLLGILLLQLLIAGISFFRQRKKGTIVKSPPHMCSAEKKEVKTGRMIAGTVGNVLLYGLCLIPAFLFPQYEPPRITGAYGVATATYTWVDENRIETYTDTGENRFVTVKFWYPKTAGSYPLVVFSHGAFGIIDSINSTCTELASNGYVVASIGHPYHAMYVEDQDGKKTYANREFINSIYLESASQTEEQIYLNSKEWMAVRTGDENFVLDTIIAKKDAGEESPFSMINTEYIGLFGHSMGGATSVQVGRERDDIDAVIDLEGSMMGEYIDFQNGTEVFNEEPYPIPILDLNSASIDEQARALPGDGYVNFYLGERAVDYRYAVIEDAGHLNFTDLPLASPFLAKMLGVGTVDAKKCIEEVNELILQFFNQYLKGKNDEG